MGVGWGGDLVLPSQCFGRCEALGAFRMRFLLPAQSLRGTESHHANLSSPSFCVFLLIYSVSISSSLFLSCSHPLTLHHPLPLFPCLARSHCASISTSLPSPSLLPLHFNPISTSPALSLPLSPEAPLVHSPPSALLRSLLSLKPPQLPPPASKGGPTHSPATMINSHSRLIHFHTRLIISHSSLFHSHSSLLQSHSSLIHAHTRMSHSHSSLSYSHPSLIHSHSSLRRFH